MVTRNANDIAVLKFAEGVEFTCKELQLYPACLPSKGEDYEGWTKVIQIDISNLTRLLQGMVTGWGRTDEGGPVSTTLRKARLPIRGDRECNTALGGGVGEGVAGDDLPLARPGHHDLCWQG